MRRRFAPNIAALYGSGGGGGGGTTPATTFSAADMPVWYDASDITTLQQPIAGGTPVAADTDPVGTMLDKSGNSHTANATNTSFRPLYKDQGGVKYLLFDGANDFLQSGAFACGQPWTRMSAVRINRWTAFNTIFAGLSTTTVTGSLQQITATPELQLYAGNGTVTHISPTLSTWVVITEFYSGLSSKMRLNGAAFNTGNGGTNVNSGVMIAANYEPGASNFAQVDVAQMFMVTRALTAPEDAAMLTYMGAKVGLVL